MPDLHRVAAAVGVAVEADVAAAAGLHAEVGAGGAVAALGHAAPVLRAHLQCHASHPGHVPRVTCPHHAGRVVVAPLPPGPRHVSVLPAGLKPGNGRQMHFHIVHLALGSIHSVSCGCD